jgi:tetratricopeptide (TPR) repeat protein
LLRVPGRLLSGARQNPLLAVVLLAGAGMILATGVSAVIFVTGSGSVDTEPTLALAFESLDTGQIHEARRLATRLQMAGNLNYQQQGGPLYVQGAALAQEAGEHWRDDERRKLYLVAARYLEEARDRGFPPGREGQGAYLFSTCLFRSGHYAESLPLLLEALKTNPQHRHELNRCLATAYLHDTSPQLEKALNFSQAALTDPNLTVEQRDQQLLQQSHIYLQLNELPEAKQSLAKCSSDATILPEITLVEARILLAEGDNLRATYSDDSTTIPDAAAEQYRAAIESLQKAQAEDKTGRIIQQCRYLTGVSHFKLGEMRAAEQAFERTRRLHFHTPEALAAALFEAEIQQAQGRHDVALATYLDALAEVDDAKSYRNPWVSLAALSDRLLAAQKRFRTANQFEATLKLSQAAQEKLPLDEMLHAEAEAQQAWGASLTKRAMNERFSVATVTLAEARGHYRAAGDLYKQLAHQRFATRHYPEDLWESGMCYLRGQNYDEAIATLNRYLDNTVRADRPQGLVALGEASLAIGKLDAAQTVLGQCIQFFPKHPWSYRARLLASRVWQEKGMLPEAKRVLLENLDHESLTPESQEWIDSQFGFGHLLYLEAMGHERQSREMLMGLLTAEQTKAGLLELERAHRIFQQSIRTLEEAVDRAPNHRLAFKSNYRIAEAWRHSARFARLKIPLEPTETQRNLLEQQSREELSNALAVYKQLQEQLNVRSEQTELSSVEESILRNTYFASADTLYDLKQYDEAIDAYSAATNRYQHEPESLEAFLQIAACHRHRQRGLEAKGTITQAAAVLTRIPPDANFLKTTRYSRKQWEELLGWLSTL